MARLALVLLAAALLGAGTARADADPASDTLYVGRVFLPLSARVSPELAQRLDADTYVADKAGKRIRVALIAARSDLGGVPSLFGKPNGYARFLAGELQFVYPGPVLVVMPQGAALAENARLVADRDVVNSKVGPGADGLARTAIELVEKLSGVRAPEGFKVPTTTTRSGEVPTTPTVPVKPKSKGGVAEWASALIAVGAVGLLLVPAFVILRRRRSS